MWWQHEPLYGPLDQADHADLSRHRVVGGVDEFAAMRTLVISDRSRILISGHIVGRSVAFHRQLADKSWEVLVDDDMGFALDQLSGDPDVALRMVVHWGYCDRCRDWGPRIDEGDTCAHCKLVG